MTSKGIMLTILYLLIAYGIIYYIFIRPKPTPNNAQPSTNSGTQSASKTATSEPVVATTDSNTPSGYITVALDSNTNIVPKYKATVFLNFPISKTPIFTCYHGKTIYVGKPTGYENVNGIMVPTGVPIGITDGCGILPVNI